MIYGKLFEKVFGKKPNGLSISEIDNMAITNLEFKIYGGNIVPKVGNIFPTLKVDIDDVVREYSEKSFLIHKN